MGKRPPFRFNTYGLVLLAVSATIPGPAGAAAGRVDFATGGATISNAKGQQQPLAKGAELNSGDTIRTDGGGRAQIRFTDGAYVSLQPNTEFAIKDYNFEGKTDGSERGFFGLAKGAMRAVTGLIGRVNKNRYQVSTPTATIGIRGTGGLISIQNDGSTLVNGSSGIWTITNASGTIDVPAGTSGMAPSVPNQPPQQTTEKPSSGPAQPPITTQLPIQQGENRDTQGVSCDTSPTAAGCTTSPTTLPPNPNPPLVSGSNFGLATHTDDTCDGDCGPSGFTISNAAAPLPAVFDSSGRLTQFTMTNSASENVTYTLDVANGGTHAEFGTAAGVLAWGRWIGQVIVDSSFSLTNTFAPDQGLHYVVGTPTPVASIPGLGNTTYTFSMIGATSPTYASGGVQPGSVSSASFQANFATGVVSNFALNATDGNGLAYSVSGLRGSLNASVPGAVFSTSGSSGVTSGCPNVCSFNANGFFAGNAATHAGFSYNFSNTAQGSDFIGVVATKR